VSATPEDDKVMSFWEHLDELRTRVTRAALAYVAATFAAWAIKDQLLAWLWQPFDASWRARGLPGEAQLHFAAPGDAFMAYFKLCMIAAMGLSAPVIFWQLWGFIAPGLYRKEKRWAFGFVFASTLFFVGGALFGWRMAFPITFDYFLSLTQDAATAGVRLQPTVMFTDYLDFVSQMLLAFGIIFELPLFLTFLSMVGLVNYLQLYRFGRWFIMIAAVVGAVLSPPDTTSMIVMTVPLIALYFLSIGLAYVFGKRPTPEQIERDRVWQEARKLQKQRWSAERRAEKLRKAAELEEEKRVKQAEASPPKAKVKAKRAKKD
jgi:sec-independent protein translocase protein TatC